MADLRFLFNDHNDEKQSETKVGYETVERIGKIMKTVDYKEKDNKFIEDKIKERVCIDVTPRMKELLMKIDYLSQLDCLCGGDDDILEVAMKFTSELRDEVSLNLHL